jgi:hypothetical protein
MERRTAIVWHTTPPIVIDEQMVLYDEIAVLGVLAVFEDDTTDQHPRIATVGSYEAALSDIAPVPPEFAAGDYEIDPYNSDDSPMLSDLAKRAQLLRVELLAHPAAIVTFSAFSSGPGPDGALGLALVAVGAGTRAVQFELDPTTCTVHFFDSSSLPVSWHDLPELATGFVTPDAEGLGGVGRRAIIEPGSYGAIAFASFAPPEAVTVSIRVGGWIDMVFPDRTEPLRFQAHTAPVPVAPASL